MATIALLSFTSGCSSPTGAEPAAVTDGASPQAVVLANAGDLVPSPDHAGRWYDVARRLESYRSFIVEKPTFATDRSVRGTPLTNEQRDSLADAYQDDFRRSLSTLYTVTESPGPGVARIRSAITQIGRSLNTQSGRRQDGGASSEMEIVDSVSGERLAAVMEVEMGEDEHAPHTDRQFHDARASFSHWAARLMLMLRDIDRLATRP